MRSSDVAAIRHARERADRCRVVVLAGRLHVPARQLMASFGHLADDTYFSREAVETVARAFGADAAAIWQGRCICGPSCRRSRR